MTQASSLIVKEKISDDKFDQIIAQAKTNDAEAILPIMFFTTAGSEVIKPMASPIIGGLLTATFTNLVLVPVLCSWIQERRVTKENSTDKKR